MHWWPKKGTAEWIDYAFDAPVRVSEASVYWFDDTGGGGCRVPASWRVLYKSGEEWVPVKAAGAYSVAKDAWNAVTFVPVRTTGPSPRGPTPDGLVGRRPRVEGQIAARVRRGSARLRGA